MMGTAGGFKAACHFFFVCVCVQLEVAYNHIVPLFPLLRLQTDEGNGKEEGSVEVEHWEMEGAEGRPIHEAK